MADRRPEASPDRTTGSDSGSAPAATSTAEWIGAASGLLALLFVVGALLVEAFSGNGAPPEVVIEVGVTTAFEGGYHVAFLARNGGDETAASLNVIGRLLGNDDVVEESEVTLGYVPPGSARRGGLFFTVDPGEYTLEVRPVGYESP